MDLNSDSPQTSTTLVETETTDSLIPTADLSKGEQVVALESSIQDETGLTTHRWALGIQTTQMEVLSI